MIAIASSDQEQSLSIAYVGVDNGLSETFPFLVRSADNLLGRKSIQSLQAVGHVLTSALRNEIDVLVIGDHAEMMPKPAHADPMLLPMRVNLEVSASESGGEFLRNVTRKARQDYVRESRRRHWRLEISSSARDFHSFYWSMHKPTMARRHGSSQRSPSLETARDEIFAEGAMFYLVEDGQRVAGMLCHLGNGETLTIRLAGVPGGNQKFYEHGRTMGLFIEIIQWAFAHGYERVDLSGGEPFISKGTFQFKRKLRPEVRIVDGPLRELRLWVCPLSDSESVRNFLVSNPMLAVRHGKLIPTYPVTKDVRHPESKLPFHASNLHERSTVDLSEHLCASEISRRCDLLRVYAESVCVDGTGSSDPAPGRL